jgi:hypothetical protein
MSCVLQSWGDYIQMSQGVIAYAITVSVLLVCTWFGHELTKEVIYMLNQIKIQVVVTQVSKTLYFSVCGLYPF